MGLDMYLYKKTYIGAQYEHRNVKGKIDITIGDKVVPIKFDRVCYIEESVGYWRKANAIHNWFVKNIQDGEDDCRDYYLGINSLKELLDKCLEVKEKAIIKEGKIQNGYTIGENGEKIYNMVDGKYIENAEEIAELLPTTDGFFFGSTEYDEYYMQDIDYTIELIQGLLKEEEEIEKLGFYSSEFVYSSSW